MPTHRERQHQQRESLNASKISLLHPSSTWYSYANYPTTTNNNKMQQWTASERKREAFLHSLTPQLERWRSRIVATTLALEEEMARRGKAEQETADASEPKVTWHTLNWPDFEA